MPRAFRHFYSLRRARAHGILLPGCPPRFRFGFCASRSACHLSRLFHFRTCSAPYAEFFRKLFRRHGSAGFKPSPAHFVLLRASRFCHCLRTPFRLFPYFSSRILPRKRVKNGPCSKHGPFSASKRRGGIRRPNRCVHFPQYQFYHGKRAIGGNLIFPGSDSAK